VGDAADVVVSVDAEEEDPAVVAVSLAISGLPLLSLPRLIMLTVLNPLLPSQDPLEHGELPDEEDGERSIGQASPIT